MATQMGYPIDPDKVPPRLEDFPEEVLISLELYPCLPDRVDGMVGFLGKDMSLLPQLYKSYSIPKRQRLIILEIILWISSRSVKASYSKKANDGKQRTDISSKDN